MNYIDLPLGHLTEFVRDVINDSGVLVYQVDNTICVMRSGELPFVVLDIPNHEWWAGYKDIELAMMTFLNMLHDRLKLRELPNEINSEDSSE